MALAGLRSGSGERTVRLIADIGGTFTDLVLVKGAGEVFTAKVSSTGAAPEAAVLDGIRSIMAEAGVDLHGDLPDHIEPVLRYLAATETPLRDLLDVLPGAVATMNQTLKRAAPDNPYCHLLAATLACAANRPVAIGGRR